MKNRIIIPGSEVFYDRVVYADFCVPSKRFFLLKGMVYTPDKIPLANAAIEIWQKYSGCKKEKRLGVTFSDEFGCYGVSLPADRNSEYILLVYSSI